MEENLDYKELMIPIESHISKQVLNTRNANRSWQYGYDEKYDFVVISKTGQIDQVVEIQGLKIALPRPPQKIHSRSASVKEQYWERPEYPNELKRIKTRTQWKSMSQGFKAKWIPYIETEFDRREEGFWFMNKGVPTYITGSHYFYVQWASIDVGYPEFREANRILWIFWEACRADPRSFGMCYLKIRRSGFSFMGSSELINIATLSSDSSLGLLSKTGKDASSMFTKKVVPINTKIPFFFKPIQDGMDRPKTDLSYAVPASKITKNNMLDMDDDSDEGLNTTISWRNTDDNSFDSEKLILMIHDESGKWVAPNNIKNNWRVTKTCLRLGSRIIGKCMMGSTSNSLKNGGQNFKDMYYDSDVRKRNTNGQTKSGLYALFIPMEWNTEGYIDIYGHPIIYTPKAPVKALDGTICNIGAIDWWKGEVDGKKGDADDLNEFYRQYPRTESHAFRDESKNSLFDLTKIYQQVDHNDGLFIKHFITTGNFAWKDGVLDTEVEWHPNPNGRFNVSWLPPKHLRNRFEDRRGVKHPLNEHIGAFGCDPYDISGVVGGGGSKGASHGLTKFHMEDAPVNQFFLEYVARPQTAEIFFEDILMACVFYGMPILIENNKTRLLYHFKNRGYRGFSMNRIDKPWAKLSKTERELGGIPNSSEDFTQNHASAIESYIAKYVGYDSEGKYRESDEVGDMYFNTTLKDWAIFDITNREKHDASISSGLAIMANQKHLYIPIVKEKKISISFASYDNDGHQSKIIRH